MLGLLERALFPLYGNVSSPNIVKIEFPNSLGTIVYFHGNGETTTTCQPELQKISQTYKMTVIAIEYLGYGLEKAPLLPNVDAILIDATNKYRTFVTNPWDIILVGRSIGSAIACHIAQRIGCLKLVLITPIADISSESFDLPWGISNLIPKILDNTSIVKDLEVPILVINAIDDEILPVRKHGKRLFEANPKIQMLYVDAGHNDFSFSDPNITEEIASFFNS